MGGATLLLLFWHGGGPAVAPTVLSADRDGFDAVAAILAGLGLFRVLDGSVPGSDRATAGDRFVAIVTPLPVSQADDGSPRRKRRLCPYEITLRVDADRRDDTWAYETLDYLQARVNNALASVPLGGFTVKHLSQLAEDAQDSADPPLYRRAIRGRFGYCYDVADGLRTAD